MVISTTALRHRAFPALGLLSLVVSCPFAIPVFWLSLTRWLGYNPSDNPGLLPSPVENHSWYVIFGSIAVLLASTLYGFRRGFPGSDYYLTASALAWFGYTAARTVFTPGIQWSYLDVLLHASFLFILITCLTSTTFTSRIIHRFQAITTIAIVPLSALALVQNAGYDPLPYSPTMPGTLDVVHGKHAVASTFGHPNYMGSYLAPLMVITFPLLFQKSSLVLRIASLAAVIIGFLALVIGGTRGPLLALAAGTAVYFLFLPKARSYWRRYLLITACCSVVLAALALLLPVLRPGFDISERLMGSKEIASRAFYWHVGLYAFADHPIFGIGPAQFDRLFWQNVLSFPGIGEGEEWHFVLASIVRGVRPGQMHNDHLQVLVETGLIGACLWAAFWASIVQRGLKLRARLTNPANSAINAALFGALTVVAVDALFGFPLRLPCSGALFWLLIGIYATWHPEKHVAGAANVNLWQ